MFVRISVATKSYALYYIKWQPGPQVLGHVRDAQSSQRLMKLNKS